MLRLPAEPGAEPTFSLEEGIRECLDRSRSGGRAEEAAGRNARLKPLVAELGTVKAMLQKLESKKYVAAVKRDVDAYLGERGGECSNDCLRLKTHQQEDFELGARVAGPGAQMQEGLLPLAAN
jgi:hypothetical protein